MTTPIILYPLNEQKLQLLGLKDDTGNFINNAVVTATLQDATGAIVGGISGVTLASIDSTGDYSYTIPGTFNLPVVPQPCTCVFTVTVSGVVKLTIVKPAAVVTRQA